jgi:hypothetical protein
MILAQDHAKFDLRSSKVWFPSVDVSKIISNGQTLVYRMPHKYPAMGANKKPFLIIAEIYI